MLVSVLHVTRGRLDEPTLAFRQRMERWSGLHEIEYVLCTDDDDPVGTGLQDGATKWKVPGSLVQVVCTAEHIGGTAAKPGLCGWRYSHVAGINAAYRASTGGVLITGDDDMEFPQNWDDIIVRELVGAATSFKVNSIVRSAEPRKLSALQRHFTVVRDAVYVSDLLENERAVLGVGDPHWGGKYQGDGLLACFILTRGHARANGGFVVWPGYDGMMCDVEFTQSAALKGVLVDRYESIAFPHNWKGNQADAGRGAGWWDATHQRHMAPDCDIVGKAVYQQRVARGFPDMLWTGEKWTENPLQDSPPVQEMVERYHKKACGGRFNFHAGSAATVA